MKSRSVPLVIAAHVMALGAAATTAHAQTAGANASSSDEIVVTAQRRDQRANDVGIPMTVFNAETIKDLSISDIADVARHTPGLTMVANAGYSGSASFSLRGGGLNNFAETGEATVALYQDGVYNASARGGSALSIFDIDRIEVLRGPQGTLYGRSATGGLVHFVSNRPTREFEASTAIGYGSFNEYHVEGSISGPVSDNLAMRLSGYWNQHDGWLNNTIGTDQYGEERYAIRGQALIDVTDGVEVLLKAEYGELTNPTGVAYLNTNSYRDAAGLIQELPPNLDAYGYGPGNNYTDFTGYRDRDGDFFSGAWAGNGHQSIDRTLLSATVTVDLGAATLTSITSYLNTHLRYLDVNNEGDTVYLNFSLNPNNQQFTQEFTLNGSTGRLDWTVGMFYLDWSLDSDRDNVLPIGYFPGFPPFDLRAELVQRTRQDVNAFAAYGQLEYQLSDQLTLIAGARAEQNTVDFAFEFLPADAYSATIFGPAYQFNRAVNGDLAGIDEVYSSGTLQLDWRPNADTLLYASIRRGIKPGTFNVPFGPLAPQDFRADEEQLLAYEAGVKATLLDGAMQFNSSTFYYDYQDYQAVYLAGVSVHLANADASIYGLDLDVTVHANDHLRLGLGASLLEGNVEDITLGTGNFGGPPNITRDREVPNMPKYSVNLFARYEWGLMGGIMALQGDVRFQDKTYFEIQNHPALTGNAYSIGNARLSWQSGGLEIAGTVQNLWEEEYVLYAADLTDFGGYLDVTPSLPRWWGVEVRYAW